jgi:uncharacterized membrane protein (DUF2068 family)
MIPTQPSTQTRTQTSTRPVPIVVAVICLVLSSLSSLATGLIPGIPLPVVVLAMILGVVGLVAAAGLWTLHRWAMIVAIVATAINGLSAVPGLFARPNATAMAGAGASIVLAVLVIVLVLLPSARRAYR